MWRRDGGGGMMEEGWWRRDGGGGMVEEGWWWRDGGGGTVENTPFDSFHVPPC